MVTLVRIRVKVYILVRKHYFFLPFSVKKSYFPHLMIRGRRRRFFRAFALASVKPKKECESAKNKKREKSESAERERKKAQICAFSPTHNGNPVLESKAARQGGKQGS